MAILLRLRPANNFPPHSLQLDMSFLMGNILFGAVSLKRSMQMLRDYFSFEARNVAFKLMVTARKITNGLLVID